MTRGKNRKRYASHFILLPNHPLVKRGVVEVEDNGAFVVEQYEELCEQPFTQFYAGIIVTRAAAEMIAREKPKHIIHAIEAFYKIKGERSDTLAVISGVDYQTFESLLTMKIDLLR